MIDLSLPISTINRKTIIKKIHVLIPYYQVKIISLYYSMYYRLNLRPNLIKSMCNLYILSRDETIQSLLVMINILNILNITISLMASQHNLKQNICKMKHKVKIKNLI